MEIIKNSIDDTSHSWCEVIDDNYCLINNLLTIEKTNFIILIDKYF